MTTTTPNTCPHPTPTPPHHQHQHPTTTTPHPTLLPPSSHPPTPPPLPHHHHHHPTLLLPPPHPPPPHYHTTTTTTKLIHCSSFCAVAGVVSPTKCPLTHLAFREPTEPPAEPPWFLGGSTFQAPLSSSVSCLCGVHSGDLPHLQLRGHLSLSCMAFESSAPRIEIGRADDSQVKKKEKWRLCGLVHRR